MCVGRRGKQRDGENDEECVERIDYQAAHGVSHHAVLCRSRKTAVDVARDIAGDGQTPLGRSWRQAIRVTATNLGGIWGWWGLDRVDYVRNNGGTLQVYWDNFRMYGQ